MKHMSHPDDPSHVVEAPEDRAVMLAAAGWVDVTPAQAPKDDDKK